METLFSLVGAPANALTLLIVSGVLFFNLVDRGYLKIGNQPGFSSRMDRLTEYVNHQQTNKIDKLIELNERCVRLLEEQKEFGVFCRNNKDKP